MNLQTRLKQGSPGRLARSLFILALLASPAAWAQVTNGGFETGTLPPWVATFAGSGAFAAVDTVEFLVTPHTGNYFFRGFDNDGVGKVSQTVSTVAGATYTLSAWVSTTDPSPSNKGRIQLGNVNLPVSCALTQNVWTQCTGVFMASGASSNLNLVFETGAGAGSVAFDDVTVTLAGAPPTVQAVPTLSEWALLFLAVAMAALGLRRLRRRG